MNKEVIMYGKKDPITRLCKHIRKLTTVHKGWILHPIWDSLGRRKELSLFML